MRDLRPAAEAVGNNRGVWLCRADRRQQHPLPHCPGYLVVSALEAEIACQTATSGLRNGGVDACLRPKLTVGVEAEDGVLMSVSLHKGIGIDLWRLPIRTSEKFREGECRRGQRGGTWVLRHK